MATTQGILASTDDSSSMKVISILTAVFLPFTFMAVRQLLFLPTFNKLIISPGYAYDADVQMA
jgi:hypothetical protein